MARKQGKITLQGPLDVRPTVPLMGRLNMDHTEDHVVRAYRVVQVLNCADIEVGKLLTTQQYSEMMRHWAEDVVANPPKHDEREVYVHNPEAWAELHESL